eukprot:111104-Chlamydomonas_euryale.AAC.1
MLLAGLRRRWQSVLHRRGGGPVRQPRGGGHRLPCARLGRVLAAADANKDGEWEQRRGAHAGRRRRAARDARPVERLHLWIGACFDFCGPGLRA